jgi:hypothetical protein
MKVVTLTENSFKIQIKTVFVSILFQFKKRHTALNEISYDNFLMSIILLKWKLIRGSNPKRPKTCCFNPKRPDRLRGPHRLLVSGYQVYFPVVKRLGLKPTTHIQLILQFRISGLIRLRPVYAFMSSTRRILPLLIIFKEQ